MSLLRTKMNTAKMCRSPPTLTLVVPPERNYSLLLQKTKMVYDQLLADKHGKLHEGLVARKVQYDDKCTELLQQDRDKALEFGVWAQEALNRKIKEFGDELTDLRRDYQGKLNHMYSQLEENWKKEQIGSNGAEIPCQVYSHK